MNKYYVQHKCRKKWPILMWLVCFLLDNFLVYLFFYCSSHLSSYILSLSLSLLCLSIRVGSSSEVPILVVGSKRDLQRQRFTQRRAVSVLVKKTWKCGYVECSAKYNWHVLLLFKELLGIAVARGLRPNHTSIRLQGALQRNRCNIMWQICSLFFFNLCLFRTSLCFQSLNYLI